MTRIRVKQGFALAELVSEELDADLLNNL